MNAQNIATIEPPSVLNSMASHYGMDRRAFEATLRATVMPANTTPEQCAAFLLVAREHGLNPFVKEIFAFPAKGGIQPVVSVDGWMKLINTHPQADGMDFHDAFDAEGRLLSVTCKIHRKDRSHPISVTEYMSECKRDTDTWKRWPARMLRHKAAIQAARYAYGFAGIMEPDEAERAQEVEVLQDKPWSEMSKEEKKAAKKRKCDEAAARYTESLHAIKAAIHSWQCGEEAEGRDFLYEVRELWGEIPQEDQIALYSCAPTDGGVFTTFERDVIHNKLPRTAATEAES